MRERRKDFDRMRHLRPRLQPAARRLGGLKCHVSVSAGGGNAPTAASGLVLSEATFATPERQGVVVWAARLAQVGRGERAAELPDEVHLGVQSVLRDARLFDEEHAA